MCLSVPAAQALCFCVLIISLCCQLKTRSVRHPNTLAGQASLTVCTFLEQAFLLTCMTGPSADAMNQTAAAATSPPRTSTPAGATAPSCACSALYPFCLAAYAAAARLRPARESLRHPLQAWVCHASAFGLARLPLRLLARRQYHPLIRPSLPPAQVHVLVHFARRRCMSSYADLSNGRLGKDMSRNTQCCIMRKRRLCRTSAELPYAPPSVVFCSRARFAGALSTAAPLSCSPFSFGASFEMSPAAGTMAPFAALLCCAASAPAGCGGLRCAAQTLRCLVASGFRNAGVLSACKQLLLTINTHVAGRTADGASHAHYSRQG